MDSRFDYDALGSILAFSDALKQLKIAHKCIYGYEIPSKPKEYFDTSRIEENTDLKTFDYSPYDLVVFLDSGTLGHLAKTYDYTTPTGKTTLNIDHHAGNNRYGVLNYVETKASTGSILFDLFIKWKVSLTPQIANYLLVCQITDTGILQFNNVNPAELKIVADLIEKGGKYFDFVSFVTLNEDLADMVVKGITYSNLKLDIKRGFAYSVLSKVEINKKGGHGYGVVPADLIKKLKGIDFVFVIKTESRSPESWSISLRSHNMEFDVLKIAQHFGGGGHKVAAGCSIPFSEAKTVDEVVDKILEMR